MPRNFAHTAVVSCVALLALLLLGCGTPSVMITPVWGSNDLQEIEVQPGQGWSAPKVAIIEVEGMLINARTSGLLASSENKLSVFVQQLERAEKDESVKAVVLRINSPGGTVTCSDTMYAAVNRFKAKTHKPVVSSAQEVAASGAYYVACASDRIIVQPTSVVGSIGVIFETFNFAGTLDKLGIKTDPIKSAPNKDIGSPFRAINPDERALMQQMVDEYYGRFVKVVTDHRTIPADDLKRATDGRVFTGEQAVKLGLADATGSLEDALDSARELSRSPHASAVMYKRPMGYSGSIYSDMSIPEPRENVTKLELPESAMSLPRGFYFLWQP